MRIDKTMKGEKVPFYLKMIPDTMQVEVRNFVGETCIGKIDDGFNYIYLPDEFTQYISGYGFLIVGNLKINKSMKQTVIEYNNNF